MSERYFKKVSKNEFSKYYSESLYDDYSLPLRKTKNSAGYDFISVEDFTIAPHEIKKIPTGIKVFMQSDEVMLIVVRSSMGFKYNIRLCNQVGVIDSDYYDNADNEGHIFVSLQNEGDKPYEVKKGESFAQGIFIKYLVSDDNIENVRTGGIGSTNRKEEC